MDNPLLKKIEAHSSGLSDDNKALLHQLTASTIKVARGEALLRIGEEPDSIRVVLQGMLCRHKLCGGTKRQILAYMLPGDFCDLYSFILDEMDHNLTAIVDSTIAEISPAKIAEMTDQPGLRQALWRSTLIDESILREWIVNLGVRSAEKRLGHFFCEIMLRLRTVGLGDPHQYCLPLTQTDLAETLGLSLVHTNKSLHKLREQGLVTFAQSLVLIPDFGRLAAFSLFDARYLHLKNSFGESKTDQVKQDKSFR